nr:hypothetical protein [Enterococcus sp. 9E7_DIV0242]
MKHAKVVRAPKKNKESLVRQSYKNCQSVTEEVPYSKREKHKGRRDAVPERSKTHQVARLPVR